MLTVKVESRFDNGIVVSYTNEYGVSFRGALLPFKTQSTQHVEHTYQKRLNNQCDYRPSESQFANPLAAIHDHQYTDMTKSVEAVLKTVPKDHLLNWNTPNDITSLPIPPRGLQTRIIRKEAQMPADSVEHRSTVVLCDRPKMPTSFHQELYLPLSNGRYYRKAKVSANRRLHGQSDFNLQKPKKKYVKRRGPYHLREELLFLNSTPTRPDMNSHMPSADDSAISPSSVISNSPTLKLKRVNSQSIFNYEPRDIPMKDFSINIKKVHIPVTLTPVTDCQTTGISVSNSLNQTVKMNHNAHDDSETNMSATTSVQEEFTTTVKDQFKKTESSFETSTSDLSFESEISSSIISSAVSTDGIITVD